MATVAPQGASPEPLGPVPDFVREVCELVVENAPRLVAVVLEYDLGEGEREAEIAGWGVVYEDGRTLVLGLDGGLRLSLGAPERALWWFGRQGGAVARLVWPESPRTAVVGRAEAA